MESAREKTQGEHPTRDQSLSGVEDLGELVIPELEDALSDLKRNVSWNRPWTEEELEILRRYYRPGMVSRIEQYLKEHFPPGRTRQAIHNKAARLGIIHRKK